jgi:putative addiction module antidote
MHRVKVTQIGNSLGLILPKEVVEGESIGKGDVFTLRKTAGGFELAPYDADFEEDMRHARDIMRRYRNALRELAK